MHNSIEIYGKETYCTEQFIDLVIDKDHIYKRYYYKINQMTRDEINNIISKIMIEDNFIIDKVSSKKIELIDSKTGKIRYTIWNDNCVEKYFMKYLGPVNPKNDLLNQIDLLNQLDLVNQMEAINQMD